MIDTSLTIELPGERIRAVVKEVINSTRVVVELTALPMVAAHNYKQGNFVECEQEMGMFGTVWIGKYKMAPIIVEEPIKEVKNVRVRRNKSDK
jgi:hypothetical protein